MIGIDLPPSASSAVDHAPPLARPSLLVRGLPWCVFLFALGVRLGHFQDQWAHPEHGFRVFHSVRGVPFSDAMGWDFWAREILRGGWMADEWAARRPVYPLVLAMAYVLTGPHYLVGIALNLLASALSTLFIFRIVDRLFGWPVALLVALWSACDSWNLALSAATLSETLGLLLITWHLDVLIRGLDRGQGGMLLAGLLFALSNLARTLTLFAAPLEGLGILLFRWQQGRGLFRGVTDACLFGLGAALPIVPFIALQYAQFGILSIQDSTAAHYFAATSPEHRVHTDAVEEVADAAGVFGPKARYDFFIQRARENRQQHPAFFWNNLQQNLWIPIQMATHWSNTFLYIGSELALVLLIAAAAFTGGAPPLSRNRRHAALATVVAILLARYFLADRAVLALTAFGAATTLTFRPGRYGFLLPALFIGSVAGMGLSAFSDYRLISLIQWAYEALYFAGIALLLQLVTGWRLKPALPPHAVAGAWRFALAAALPEREPTPPTPHRALRFARHAAVALASLGVVGTASDVAWRQWQSAGRTQPPLPLDTSQVARTLTQIHRDHPDLLSDSELQQVDVLDPGFAARDPAAARGHLLAAVGLIAPYVYEFPAGAADLHPSRFFAERPYDHSLFYFDGRDGEGQRWMLLALAPGLQSARAERSFLLLGRADYLPLKYQETLVHLVALVPRDPATGQLDLAHIIYPQDQAYLRDLAACRQSTAQP